MTSKELRALEEARAAGRRRYMAPDHTQRDLKPSNGWNPRTLRREVEGEFRGQGAKVYDQGRAG